MNKILVMMLFISSVLSAQYNSVFPIVCDAVKAMESPQVISAGKNNSMSESGYCPDPCIAAYVITYNPTGLGAGDLKKVEDFSSMGNGLCKIYQCTTLNPCDFTGCTLYFKNEGIYTYEVISFLNPELNRLIFPNETFTYLFDQYQCGSNKSFDIVEQSTQVQIYNVYITCGICRNLE